MWIGNRDWPDDLSSGDRFGSADRRVLDWTNPDRMDVPCLGRSGAGGGVIHVMSTVKDWFCMTNDCEKCA